MSILLGLKGSTDPIQLADRLRYRPDVYEFFLDEQDFTTSGLQHLRDVIAQVQQVTPRIVLHQPMRYQGQFTELITREQAYPDLYRFIWRSTFHLLNIAATTGVQVLIHGAYARQTEQQIATYPDFATAQAALFQRLDYLKQIGGKQVMFENSMHPLFSYSVPAFNQQLLQRHYRLAFDTSHCFIGAKGDNQILQQALMQLAPQVVHYHLVDSFGKSHDSLPLGQGKINWSSVLPRLNPRSSYIYEINLVDQSRCREQIASYRYLQSVALQMGIH